MELKDRQSKIWLYASWLVYTFVLIFFASLYFKERTLFLDNAFLLFRLIQDDGIVINAFRWPAAIYRLVPFIALKLGLSLKALMWCFSLSYVLIPVIILGYIILKLKNLPASIIFAFLTTVILAHGFFWNNSELFLCIQLIVLLSLCIYSNKVTLAIILSVLIAWLHPLSVLAMGFLVGLKYINGLRTKSLYLPAFVFGINYGIKVLFFPNWYDTNKKIELLNNLKQLDHSIFSSLYNYVSDWDQLLSLAFILAFGFLVIKKNYKQLFLLSIFILICLFLFIVSKPDSELSFYNELNNYLFYLFLALCLIEEAVKTNARFAFIAISAFLVFASFRWVDTSREYSQRIRWYQEKLEKEDRIIYINPADELNELILPWASAYESLLISSLDSRSSRSILYTNNRDKAQFEGVSELLITEYKTYQLNSLDKNYFHLENKAYNIIYLD